jgi:uncharacterized coiled-coil DUF342 family protein
VKKKELEQYTWKLESLANKQRHEIAELREDARELRRQLVTTTIEERELPADADEIEERVKPLEGLVESLCVQVNESRHEIAELRKAVDALAERQPVNIVLPPVTPVVPPDGKTWVPRCMDEVMHRITFRAGL